MKVLSRLANFKENASGNEQDYWMSNNGLDLPGFEGLYYIARLLELSHTLSGDAHKCVEHLCQEVDFITQKRVKIFIRQDHEKSYEYIDTAAASFPLQFKSNAYGTLYVAYHDKKCSDEPSMPLPLAQLLAQMCSWILNTIEQTAFTQKLYQQLDYQLNGPLTRREKEVLSLMFSGYDQQAIAKALSISPATVKKHRQHIYNQLGVHCEQDAVLAAYFSGMLSLIDKCL